MKNSGVSKLDLDRFVQSIALFMAVLVISIPFCISSAEASLIQSVKVYDQNQKEGMVNSDEGTMYVDVILDHSVQLEEIFYETDTGFLGEINSVFDFCEGNTCIFNRPISSKKDGKYTATIRVDTVDTDEHETKTVKFCADSVAPTVLLNSIKQLKEYVEISYTAQDNAQENMDCLPGLKEAELFINDRQVETKEFTGTEQAQSGVFKLSISDIENYADEGGDYSGEQGEGSEGVQPASGGSDKKNIEFDVRVEATDNLGNRGISETKSRELDSNKPEILADTLKVTDASNMPVEIVAGANEAEGETIGSKTLLINIHLDILEEDLVTSKTFADLTDVTMKEEDSSVKPECTPENTVDGMINHCTWSNVLYDGMAGGIAKFTAEDKVGNKVTLERGLPFKKHSGKPIVNNIYVLGQEGAEQIFAKKNFKVGVTVSDPAGFNTSKNLILSLSGITGNTKPYECNETLENTWDCYYNLNAGSDKPEGTISIKKSSANDLGQAVDIEASAVKEIKVKFDFIAPESIKFSESIMIDDIQYEEGKPYITSSSDCPTYQEGLDLTILVKDHNSPTVIVDSSPISSNEITLGECTEADLSGNEGIDEEIIDTTVAKYNNLPVAYECTVSIENIIPTTSKSPIPFSINVTDPAGNTLKLEHETKLCAFNPAAVPDCVSGISISNVPKIFRTTLEKADIVTPVTLNYNFKGCGNDLTIVNQQIVCNGVEFQLLNGDRIEAKNGPDVPALMIMKKQSLSQNDPNSFDPETGEAGDTGSFYVECKATMSLRFKELYYQTPEEEPLVFTVPLEGFVLGEPSDAMTKVLKELSEDIDAEVDISKGWKIVLNILEVMCKLVEIVSDINSILQSIKSIIYVIALAADKIPATSAGAKSMWLSFCMTLDEINYFVTEFFWPSSTLPIPPKVGHIFKWLCLYVECKLFDPGTWATVVNEGGSLALNAAAKSVHENKMQSDAEGYEKLYGEGSADASEYHVSKTTGETDVNEKIERTNTAYKDVGEGVYKVDANGKVVPYSGEGASGVAQEDLGALNQIFYGSDTPPKSDDANFYNKEVTLYGGKSLDPRSRKETKTIIISQDGTTITTIGTGKKGTQTMTSYKIEEYSKSYLDTSGPQHNVESKFYTPRVTGISSKITSGENFGMTFTSADGIAVKTVGSEQYDAWTNTDVEKLEEEIQDAWLDPNQIDPYRISEISWMCPKAGWIESLKRQQIMCAKKLCYINSVKYGTNPKVCADAYDVHICLYVESALSQIWGSAARAWFRSFAKQLLYGLIFQAAMFIAYTLPCYPYYTPSGSGATQYCTKPMATGGPMSVYCGLMMSALSIYEIAQTISKMSKDGYWDEWFKKVEISANYCDQADDAEEGLLL